MLKVSLIRFRRLRMREPRPVDAADVGDLGLVGDFTAPEPQHAQECSDEVMTEETDASGSNARGDLVILL